eukprot:gene14038-21471_t
MWAGVSIRHLSLCVLVVQNASSVLLMRYSRTTGRDPMSPLFVPATTVVVAECLKLIACLIALTVDAGSLRQVSSSAQTVLVDDFSTVLKLIIPAALYTLQNNLLFLALENLEATLFQVTYQLKLLLTAVFSVILLQKKLSTAKWASLLLLFFGVVLTQLPSQSSAAIPKPHENRLVGVAACLVCGSSSAFASVYFEKMLKIPNSAYKTTIWTRNLQLGISSVPLSLAALLFAYRTVPYTFFQGYTPTVWFLILVQAGGGLLVAVVIKYADNILKGFATALAILLSGFVSYAFLDLVPSTAFCLGSITVVASTFAYSAAS